MAKMDVVALKSTIFTIKAQQSTKYFQWGLEFYCTFEQVHAALDFQELIEKIELIGKIARGRNGFS